MIQCGILHVSFFQDQPPSLSLLGSSTITAVYHPLVLAFIHRCTMYLDERRGAFLRSPRRDHVSVVVGVYHLVLQLGYIELDRERERERERAPTKVTVTPRLCV